MITLLFLIFPAIIGVWLAASFVHFCTGHVDRALRDAKNCRRQNHSVPIEAIRRAAVKHQCW